MKHKRKRRMQSLETLDKILGLIYGQALGDAFGLTTEFETKKNVGHILAEHKVRFRDQFPYPFRSKHAKRWRPGDWTDDTDQMICIMESLTANKLKCNVQDFAKRLFKWVNQGFSECDDKFGCGIGQTVGSVISEKEFFTRPHEMAKKVWQRYNESMAANGAVMRTSVVSVAHYRDLNTVIQNSIDFCKVTHYDPRCVVSCIFINTILSLMLQTDDYESILEQAYFDSVEYLNQQDQETNDFSRYAKAITVQELDLSEPSAIGYTYKCMGCGAFTLQKIISHAKTCSDKTAFDYKEIFDEIANEGGDADTNLTVVGAIAGAFIGYSNLDTNWLAQMPYKSFLDDHVIEFLGLLNFDKKDVKKLLNSLI